MKQEVVGSCCLPGAACVFWSPFACAHAKNLGELLGGLGGRDSGLFVFFLQLPLLLLSCCFLLPRVHLLLQRLLLHLQVLFIVNGFDQHAFVFELVAFAAYVQLVVPAAAAQQQVESSAIRGQNASNFAQQSQIY